MKRKLRAGLGREASDAELTSLKTWMDMPRNATRNPEDDDRP